MNRIFSFSLKLGIFFMLVLFLITCRLEENLEQDSPGFEFTTISGNTTEAGGTATFTIKLKSQPTDDVTISTGSSDTTEGTLSPSSLTYTSSNWSTAQTVAVTGVNDATNDGDITFQATFTPDSSTGDSSYNGLDPDDVNVVNEDNDISSWSFVDGGGSRGINFNTDRDAFRVSAATFDDLLYLSWAEASYLVCCTTNYKIRVASYDGDDWSFVDGNTKSGLNRDPDFEANYSELEVYNGNLYLAWREVTDVSAGYRALRVKKYDKTSNTWSFVDGGAVSNGIDSSTGATVGEDLHMLSFDGKLYVTWIETGKVRVKAYNGSSWSFVDGGSSGLNYSNTAERPFLATWDDTLYSAWTEYSDSSIQQIRVAKYVSGTTWNFVDGSGTVGINKDTGKHASFPRLVSFNSKLYVTWHEKNSSIIYQGRVKAFDGTSWNFVDGDGVNGINRVSSVSLVYHWPLVYQNQLHLIFNDEDFSPADQLRVSVFNGNESSPVWGYPGNQGADGLNKNTAKDAQMGRPFIYNNEFYIAWGERVSATSRNIRVAKAND